MIVPKMSWRDYLELSKGLRADPRFALANQDIENGFVKFRTLDRLRVFQYLLDYHNGHGLPISTIKLKAVSAKILRDLGFDFNTWKGALEDVRVKSDNGEVVWYVTRCPTCADRGTPDTKGHGLVFSSEGQVHCFRGCTYWQIIGSDKPTVNKEEVKE